MNLFAHMSEELFDWNETTLTKQSLLMWQRSEEESLNDETISALINVILEKSWRNLHEGEFLPMPSRTGKKGKKKKGKKAKKARK